VHWVQWVDSQCTWEVQGAGSCHQWWLCSNSMPSALVCTRLTVDPPLVNCLERWVVLLSAICCFNVQSWMPESLHHLYLVAHAHELSVAPTCCGSERNGQPPKGCLALLLVQTPRTLPLGDRAHATQSSTSSPPSPRRNHEGCNGCMVVCGACLPTCMYSIQSPLALVQHLTTGLGAVLAALSSFALSTRISLMVRVPKMSA
jgi:hypothetical protein